MRHTGIIETYDLIVEPETKALYFTMEYVDGETLKDIIDRRRKEALFSMSLDEVKNFLIKISEPLEYAHRQGVIHRDLKPSNIMFKRDGGIKLMDFGIAKVLSATHVTHHTGAVGSMFYMSPEQQKGDAIVTVASDVYSLGVMVYEFLTGKLPGGRFKPVSELARNFPKVLDEVVTHWNKNQKSVICQ